MKILKHVKIEDLKKGDFIEFTCKIARYSGFFLETKDDHFIIQMCPYYDKDFKSDIANFFPLKKVSSVSLRG